jgi:hypothetical protein
MSVRVVPHLLGHNAHSKHSQAGHKNIGPAGSDKETVVY